MIFLLYSHWFGALISLCYAFIDLILFFKKKVKIKSIVSYLIAGLSFLPSFIILLKYHNGDIGDYGVDYPSISLILNVIRFLVNNVNINIAFLILAIITIILKKNKNENSLYIKFITYSSIMLFIGTVVYSRYIYVIGSIVRNRYYVTILPHVVIILSYFLTSCIEKIKEVIMKIRDDFSKNIVTLFAIVSISTIGCVYIYIMTINTYYYAVYYQNAVGNVNYRDTANYLSMQKDIYSDDTLVICTYGITWVKYYFEYKNIVAPKNIIAVDPLTFPHTPNMSSVNLKDLEYCVKNGEDVSSKESEIESEIDISNYNTIYYFKTYRVIDNDVMTYIQNNYSLEESNEVLGIKKYVKNN